MDKDTPRKSLYDVLGEGRYGWARWRLAETGYLSGEVLALVLKTEQQPPPDWFREYLIKHLLGQTRKKTGPKPALDAEWREFELEYTRLLYRKALRIFRRLIARERRRAKERRDVLPKAEEAAHERALEWLQTRKSLFKDLNPRTLHNLLTRPRKVTNRELVHEVLGTNPVISRSRRS